MNDIIYQYPNLTIDEWTRVNSLVDTHNVYIVAVDKRDKSIQQIRFMYVLLNAISLEFNGTSNKDEVEELKYSLYQDYCDKNGIEFFRTSTASVTEMRLFLNWLIKYMAQDLNITIALELIEHSFKEQWIYAMTCSRKCVICGKSFSDIHHCNKIGSGKNRNKQDHTRYKVVALCREHHSIEHSTGALLKANKLDGVYLSQVDFEILGIKGTYEEGVEINE